ncbi:hypothetical protein Aph01nite_59390 [Acrocarpospora phusangensis]|uniref:Uncharacterized protein n=1 Tax=Acrocarpospora phusangensis TaxID=1070424 RepID=A0A919QEA9_9ACTN|nr:hypothetical protein [Acrocarpospora phusangensis]GIH27629.1 hypothetical protein Aph01nite_59390 [Acrocarpospora phusangensis]
MTYVEKTYSRLDSLRSQVPLLPDAMIPGTPRRWVERDLSASELARQAVEVREDRVDRVENSAKGLKPTGNSKAPLNLGVLDAQVDITVSIRELEEAVCDRLGITPLAGASAIDRITRIIALLSRIAVDDELAEHVLAEGTRLERRARQALGDDEPVYKIKGRCPVCDSVSLRAFPDRQVVVCVNSQCVCDDLMCLCHATKPIRHRWIHDQWDVLNNEISAEERNAA